MVSNPVPDARRGGPGIGWKERRTAPRHAAVWVRVGGQWRRGRIIEWVRQIDRDGWDCVILADEPVNGPPWQGRYAFDPRSIRARYTDQPPADLAGTEEPKRADLLRLYHRLTRRHRPKADSQD